VDGLVVKVGETKKQNPLQQQQQQLKRIEQTWIATSLPCVLPYMELRKMVRFLMFLTIFSDDFNCVIVRVIVNKKNNN